MFAAFYKQDMAKRLLMSQSMSKDLERFMIQQFKIGGGSMYTNNMEGMFKDMDILRRFQRRSRRIVLPDPRTIPLNPNSRASLDNWMPSYTPLKITLPSQIKTQEVMFTDFYDRKYSEDVLRGNTDCSSSSCTISSRSQRTSRLHRSGNCVDAVQHHDNVSIP